MTSSVKLKTPKYRILQRDAGSRIGFRVPVELRERLIAEVSGRENMNISLFCSQAIAAALDNPEILKA